MRPPSDESVVVAYYAALNRADEEALAALLADQFDPGVPGLPRGRDAWLRLLAEYRAGFPDLHTEVTTQFGCDGRVCAVTWTEGTHRGPFLGHPPTGRRFGAQGIDVFQVDGGLLAGHEGVFDTLAMLHQLGLVVPGAVPSDAVPSDAVPAGAKPAAPDEATR